MAVKNDARPPLRRLHFPGPRVFRVMPGRARSIIPSSSLSVTPLRRISALTGPRFRPKLLPGSQRALAQVAGPGVVGFRPAFLLDVSGGGFLRVVEADRQQLDTVAPFRVLPLPSLHVRHRLLARLAPGGPEFDDDYLAAVFGK